MVRLDQEELRARYRVLRERLSGLERELFALMRAKDKRHTVSLQDEIERLMPQIDELDEELVGIERLLPPVGRG